MLTSDGVNEILAEGRIMQYLITYAENGEFERVEGILVMRMLEDFNGASNFTMLQVSRRVLSFNENVDRDDGCGCYTISHSFWYCPHQFYLALSTSNRKRRQLNYISSK